jgi:hypothetical protein
VLEVGVERSVKDSLINAVVDWPNQRTDFEYDGSLRDIYIQNASLADWMVVVARIVAGDHHARFQRGGVTVPVPIDLFGEPLDLMTFSVGNVVLDCHFFMPTEVEFSFGPASITQAEFRDLLGFMIDIGDATSKSVIMTPENMPQLPIVTYAATEGRLVWHPPPRRR